MTMPRNELLCQGITTVVAWQAAEHSDRHSFGNTQGATKSRSSKHPGRRGCGHQVRDEISWDSLGFRLRQFARAAITNTHGPWGLHMEMSKSKMLSMSRFGKLFFSLSLPYRCCRLTASSHSLSAVLRTPVILGKVHRNDLILTSLPL